MLRWSGSAYSWQLRLEGLWRPCALLALGAMMQLALLPILPASGKEPGQVRQARILLRAIRPLPGGLDTVPVFNSNCPEVVTSNGVLLSTFPKQFGSAGLDYEFDGNFDIFAHHITSSGRGGRRGDLYLGLLIGNTGDKPVQVRVLNAASYLSRPDAPFISLPAILPNDDGRIFAGPGDRVTTDLLMNKEGTKWKRTLEVPPGKQILLHRLPIPVSRLKPHLNGRTYMAQLQSTGPVRVALVASFAQRRHRLAGLLFGLFTVLPRVTPRRYLPPPEEEFLKVFNLGHRVSTLESPPSAPDDKGPVRYGRVSGVSVGSCWQATLKDEALEYLAVPDPEKPISYVLSSLDGATFGSGQIQSAPLAVRYDRTAYRAHGNYGVKYDLLCPLKNPSNRNLNLSLSLETPVKSDVRSGSLKFFEPPLPQVFFRGTIKITVLSNGVSQTVKYFHLVQRYGESGRPFITLPIAARSEETIRIELFYPPDCTPPQLITFSTSNKGTQLEE